MLSSTADQKLIRELVDRWAASVRARDLDGIMAAHADDILMFDVPPPFQSKGLAAYRETWATFFSWAQDLGVFDIKEMHITAGADVAFVSAHMQCAGMTEGKRLDLDFRLTIGLQKRDNEWLITHEHHSIPAIT